VIFGLVCAVIGVSTGDILIVLNAVILPGLAWASLERREARLRGERNPVADRVMDVLIIGLVLSNILSWSF
jgi:hypothetical protein